MYKEKHWQVGDPCHIWGPVPAPFRREVRYGFRGLRSESRRGPAVSTGVACSLDEPGRFANLQGGGQSDSDRGLVCGPALVDSLEKDFGGLHADLMRGLDDGGEGWSEKLVYR